MKTLPAREAIEAMRAFRPYRDALEDVRGAPYPGCLCSICNRARIAIEYYQRYA